MKVSGQVKQIGNRHSLKRTQLVSSPKKIGKLKKIRWRKISRNSQKEIVLLLSDLLQNGFTLQESLEFSSKLLERDKHVTACFDFYLKKGEPFYEGFSALGFPKEVVAQISLSEIHGDLSGTLEKIGKRMTDEAKQRVLFRKVMSYPLLLISFLVVMLLGLKYFLLPQMDFGMENNLHQKNPGIVFIEYAPTFLLGGFISIVMLIVLVRLFLKRFSAINQSKFLVQLPFIRTIFQYHFTSFFSLEWGKLILQGLELRTVIDVMKKDGSTQLMREIAEVLQEELEQGNPIHEQLARWSFFTPSLSTIIQQGEVKGKLGEELTVYGRKLWEILLVKTEKWFQLIQPIVFLFVAVLIVAIYAAMLLPMYQNMEGIL